MKRGDLVICKVKTGLNYDNITLTWDYTDRNGTLLLIKKSISGSNMYLVKLEDGEQIYFYDDQIRLDKVRMRQNILDQLGI